MHNQIIRHYPPEYATIMYNYPSLFPEIPTLPQPTQLEEIRRQVLSGESLEGILGKTDDLVFAWIKELHQEESELDGMKIPFIFKQKYNRKLRKVEGMAINLSAFLEGLDTGIRYCERGMAGYTLGRYLSWKSEFMKERAELFLKLYTFLNSTNKEYYEMLFYKLAQVYRAAKFGLDATKPHSPIEKMLQDKIKEVASRRENISFPYEKLKNIAQHELIGEALEATKEEIDNGE